MFKKKKAPKAFPVKVSHPLIGSAQWAMQRVHFPGFAF